MNGVSTSSRIARRWFRMLAWTATATSLVGCARRTEAPVSSHRPAHMPCAIVGHRDFGALGFTTYYRLYYQQDGLLALATEDALDSKCKAPDAPCWVTKTPTSTIRYRYEAGVLTEVQRTCLDQSMFCNSTVLSIGYAQGHPDRYSLSAIPSTETASKDGRKPRLTIIQASPTGDIETITHLRFHFPKKQDIEQRSTFVGRHEPFASSPIVWPFATDTLYFGWEIRHSQVKQMELLSERETFTYSDEGRIGSRVTYPNHSGVAKLDFHYDCPEDIPADRVSLAEPLRK